MIDEVYKKFIPIVTKESFSHWHQLKDETEFEQRCYEKLKHCVDTFDESKGKIFSYCYKAVQNELSDFLNRRKMQRDHLTSYEVLADSGWDKQDALASVEHDLLLNEKAALLAEGDSKRLAILNAWIDGCNDSEISRLLAQSFGGKPDSHRKYIQRFRTECQTTLASAV
jgi:DNA-directed RNA polymerase specialized sigma24 family protein